MVVDVLASILDKAMEVTHIRGIIPHLVGDLGVSLMRCPVSKINFNKSAVMVLGYPPAAAHSIVDRLNCQLGSFPMEYLGMPISDCRFSVAEL
ncbi:ABC transporter G family member 37 [Hordeum vulgare]|nr:ABC transporter G family member 37 [Hordeum vulgare]